MDSITIDAGTLQMILLLLGCVVGALVIAIAVKAFILVKRVDKIVEDNSDNINKILKTLPDLTNNINESVLSIKDTVDSVGATVEGVEHGILGLTSKENNQKGIFDIVGVVAEVVKMVMKMFNE